MPVKKYTHHISTLKPEEHIHELNREIADYCKEHPLVTDEDKQLLCSRLLRRTGVAAFQGASRLEGGPFGAMLVDFNTPDGIPRVEGFGTNHVVPNSDPSAHAEMTAIRDTAKRLGRTDLSGLTLVTSCECCPMCLSAATGCKVDKIYFAATRQDAANVGFSDADQYRLMTAGGIEQHAQKAADRIEAENTLQGHDAVVVVNYKGQPHIFYGDYGTANPSDPTDLPIVQAIKNACHGLAELLSQESGKEERVFHLPEDTTLISRQMPHPMSLITADWARIGRVRGTDPGKPELDSPQKNTARILYLNDELETMQVKNQQGQSSAIEPQKVWEEIANPSAVHLGNNLGHAHKVAFEEWDRLIKTGFMPRY
jgi:tRNA(Arg) A34 adenosine deaminase TadA